MSLYQWICDYIFEGLDLVKYEPYIALTLVVLCCLFAGFLIRAFTAVLNIFIK